MITHSRKAKIHLNLWSAGRFDGAFRAIRCQLRTAGAPVLCCGQQSAAHHVQIHQHTSDKQSRRVLFQATVAHLAESKDALEYQKRVLDFGPHVRLRLVFLLASIAQRAIAAALLVGKVFRVGCPFSNRIALPGIGRIAPDARFVTMQQVLEHLAVMDIRRGSGDRVDQLRLAIDTNVRFHTEIQLVAFLRLMHLRVTRLVLVLGRTGRIDNRRIHDGTGVHLHAVFLQVFTDQGKQPIAQIVRFKQMTELADRGLIRHGFPTQVDTHEAPHGSRIVQCFFHRRIGQVEPVLQEMNAEHTFQTDRWAACTFRHRVKRLDHFAQVAPGNVLIHLVEKLFPVRRFANFLEAFVSERLLSHSAIHRLAWML